MGLQQPHCSHKVGQPADEAVRQGRRAGFEALISRTKEPLVLAQSLRQAPHLTLLLKVRELFGIFSHEPRCTRAPDGPFVCYFSHNPEYAKLPHAGACRGDGNGSSSPACNCNNGGPKPTYMSFTTDLDGDWSRPVLVANVTTDANVSPCEQHTAIQMPLSASVAISPVPACARLRPPCTPHRRHLPQRVAARALSRQPWQQHPHTHSRQLARTIELRAEHDQPAEWGRLARGATQRVWARRSGAARCRASATRRRGSSGREACWGRERRV